MIPAVPLLRAMAHAQNMHAAWSVVIVHMFPHCWHQNIAPSPEQAREDVNWSCLPAPLAEHILHLAFQDGSRGFPQWLCMSLVCKCDFTRTAAVPTKQANVCYMAEKA